MRHRVAFCPANEALQAFEKSVGRLLSGKRIAYVGVPVYENFGDALIYLGARVLLERLSVASVSFFSANEFNVNPSIASRGGIDAIVIQGGGNFGDLYLLHQRSRIVALEEYLKIPVVSLPQSIHYQSAPSASELRIFSEAKNFYCYVRDEESRAFCQDHFGVQATLAPDTAHFLARHVRKLIQRQASRSKSTWTEGSLIFKRADREAHVSLGVSHSLRAGDTMDWPDIYTEAEKLGIRSSRAMLRYLGSTSLLLDFWHRAYCRYLWLKLERVANVFATYEDCHTDRLHGAILATMVGIPTYFYDNSYRKLGRYYDALELMSSGHDAE